jgi:hypothetical protein
MDNTGRCEKCRDCECQRVAVPFAEFWKELERETLVWEQLSAMLPAMLVKITGKAPDYFTLAPGEVDDVWTIPVSLLEKHGIPLAPEGVDCYYTAYGDLCAGRRLADDSFEELYIFRDKILQWENL